VSRREKQAAFFDMLAQLAVFARMRGLSVAIVELYRSAERQRQLVDEGKAWTYKSKHLLGLAADLYIILPFGQVSKKARDYRPLGDFWVLIGGRWGGHFSPRPDVFHFEYRD